MCLQKRNQFHDVIPGSSINEVYKDSTEHYLHVLDVGGKLLENSLQSFSAESKQVKKAIFMCLNFIENNSV